MMKQIDNELFYGMQQEEKHSMEVFFVYGLLILFALGVLLMVGVLLSDPNRSTAPEEAEKASPPEGTNR